MSDETRVTARAGIRLLFSIGPFEDPAGRISTGTAVDEADGSRPKKIGRLAWSPDGEAMVLPCRDNYVRICDGSTGNVVSALAGHTRPVTSATWSPDGRYVASSGYDETARIWDVQTGQTVQVLDSFPREVGTVAWSPDGGRLAATEQQDGVTLWDTETWELRGRLTYPGVVHAAWSPDGLHIASGSEGGGIMIWDAGSLEPCGVLEGHGHASMMVAWGPDSRTLASAAKDGTVRLWDAVQGVTLATMDIAEGDPEARERARVTGSRALQVLALSFMKGGGILAAKCRDDLVRLWDCDTWRLVGTIEETSTQIGWNVGLAFHPELPRLASLGERDTIVRVWELDTDRLLLGLRDPDRLL